MVQKVVGGGFKNLTPSGWGNDPDPGILIWFKTK